MAKSPIAEHFERIRPENLPAVAAVEASSTETNLSDETNAGLVRLANFIKKTLPRPRKKRQNKALEAYESVLYFEDRLASGRALNLYA